MRELIVFENRSPREADDREASLETRHDYFAGGYALDELVSYRKGTRVVHFAGAPTSADGSP